MINIQKSTVNNIILTVTEKSTLSPAYYLFKFVYSSDYNHIKYFTCPDTSSYVDRYNQFMIEENSVEDLEDGVVSLLAGSWDYFIYEQSSATNLDPDNTGSLVEQGKVIVEGVDNTISEVYR
jgi:hypothetical protein